MHPSVPRYAPDHPAVADPTCCDHCSATGSSSVPLCMHCLVMTLIILCFKTLGGSAMRFCWQTCSGCRAERMLRAKEESACNRLLVLKPVLLLE